MSRLIASHVRTVVLIAGGAAVAAAAVAWLLRRPVEASEASEPARSSLGEPAAQAVPLPTRARVAPEPDPAEGISARPSDRPQSVSSPDDYDALSPEDLGAIFLAGATDTALDEPPSSTAELQGFRIFEQDELGRDGLERDELVDEPSSVDESSESDSDSAVKS